MNFPCTSCGLCCQRAGIAVGIARQLVQDGNTNAYVKEVAEFPFRFDHTGRCENLGADNRCAVYESRPDICSVKKTWEKHHATSISESNYYLSASMLCNKMMQDSGVSENFYIQIPMEEIKEGIVYTIAEQIDRSVKKKSAIMARKGDKVFVRSVGGDIAIVEHTGTKERFTVKTNLLHAVADE